MTQRCTSKKDSVDLLKKEKYPNMRQWQVAKSSRILAPLVLLANLCLLFRREIVHDVELLADLLRGLPLDHRRNLRASQIEERLDVQVVRGKDQFKQDLLVNVNVFHVPFANAAFSKVR